MNIYTREEELWDHIAASLQELVNRFILICNPFKSCKSKGQFKFVLHITIARTAKHVHIYTRDEEQWDHIAALHELGQPILCSPLFQKLQM